MAKPAYMGRGILAGLTPSGKPAFVYFVEGRSPPSRKRRLEIKKGGVFVNLNSGTDRDEMKRSGGIPELLLYNAMKADANGLIVAGNGFHTDCDPVWNGKALGGVIGGKGMFRRMLEGSAAGEAMAEALRLCGSETDLLKTARIACIADASKEPCVACMGIVVRPGDEGGDRVAVHETRMKEKGVFTMFATYGVNDPPYEAGLPPDVSAVSGWTKKIRLEGETPEELAREAWKMLPEDILVGTAAAVWDGGFRFAVRNAKE